MPVLNFKGPELRAVVNHAARNGLPVVLAKDVSAYICVFDWPGSVAAHICYAEDLDPRQIGEEAASASVDRLLGTTDFAMELVIGPDVRVALNLVDGCHLRVTVSAHVAFATVVI